MLYNVYYDVCNKVSTLIFKGSTAGKPNKEKETKIERASVTLSLNLLYFQRLGIFVRVTLFKLKH